MCSRLTPPTTLHQPPSYLLIVRTPSNVNHWWYHYRYWSMILTVRCYSDSGSMILSVPGYQYDTTIARYPSKRQWEAVRGSKRCYISMWPNPNALGLRGQNVTSNKRQHRPQLTGRHIERKEAWFTALPGRVCIMPDFQLYVGSYVWSTAQRVVRQARSTPRLD